MVTVFLLAAANATSESIVGTKAVLILKRPIGLFFNVFPGKYLSGAKEI